MPIQDFIARWSRSSAAERANKDLFLAELCSVLGVEPPRPATGNPDEDRYVFEKPVEISVEGDRKTIGFIDLYKHGHFLLEAKQGSGELSLRLGTAKRGTSRWNIAMLDAYGQALGYARTLQNPPPFLIVCDIGHCFDLYSSFDGSGNYQKWPDALSSRIWFRDLERHAGTVRAIFTDPHSLDQSKISARVTRDIAGHVANLARALEDQGHDPTLVAQFLMRCLFTMFAEDVELIKKGLFAKALEERWIEQPDRFKPEVESLWKMMNEGGDIINVGKILRFNGGLFADPTALLLTKEQLIILAMAAQKDWKDVEPAIFGTLLERALDPKERHRLGAHYTPRAYVERLVRPTIEEPLRAEWEGVRAEVRQIMSAAKSDDDPKAMVAARKPVYAFYDKLTRTRVLDPACGSGNFLYVALDLFKRIENEILALLHDLGDEALFVMHGRSVTPEQFLGIEIKPWAKEIAELVLWIGYLQWQIRNRGWRSNPPEPVLRDYHNIECRDAVLAYDRVEPALDDAGNPITRWDGETMKKHPVTGEDVPDDTARVPVLNYVNPRKAEWPEAEYIVGNPPFIGNKRMRDALGDQYVESLRRVHQQVPESADFVMYWWDSAASLVRQRRVRRFGFITTNSITQPFGRRVVQAHLEGRDMALVFAVADHPWVDSATGAAVRIAMTVGALGDQHGTVVSVTREHLTTDDEVRIEFKTIKALIGSDLRPKTTDHAVVELSATRGLASRGMTLVGAGFIVDPNQQYEPQALKPLVDAQTLLRRQKPKLVIDLFGYSEEDARNQFPKAYQHLYDTVRPGRLQQKRKSYARSWWIFAEPRSTLRTAIAGLHRAIGTVETARHGWFSFIDLPGVPEQTLVVFALQDAAILGVLSSKVHVLWSLRQGGTLEDRPRYTIKACFGTFPFPDSEHLHQQRIRDLGEQLDAHRKRQQELHPDLTITGMYNVLEKLRSGEALTPKEKVVHEQGLVSVLKQIHDDLDAAVFDAYGWPHDLTDEEILERLVALNAERAEEEKRGIIRWLRPEFQNPDGEGRTEVQDEIDIEPASAKPAAAKGEKPEKRPWPSSLPEQITAIRDTFLQNGTTIDTRTVAQHFKGARTREVHEVLAALEALGHLIAVSDEPKLWKAAR